MPSAICLNDLNLHPDTVSDDCFLGGKLKLYQPVKGCRAAIDSLFLAAATPILRRAEVLELGVGSGVVSCCLLSRCPETYVTGVDVFHEIVHLAQLNHQRNGLGDRFQGVVEDAQHLHLRRQFDYVISNPPFLEQKRAFSQLPSLKTAAYIEGKTGLESWVKTCLRHLKPKGFLVLIFRADRADQLIRILCQAGGSIRLIPLLPQENQPAKRIIIQYQRDSKTPFKLEAGWVVHRLDGTFTTRTQGILREGKALNEA